MSAALEWTSALAVGISEVDRQHQELFRRAGRLVAALRGGDRGEVAPLLSFLEGYVNFHFEAEERLMREHGYPGIDDHAAAHQAFRLDFSKMVLDFYRTGPTALVALTIHNWLSDWLRQHIAGKDQEFGRFLAADER